VCVTSSISGLFSTSGNRERLSGVVSANSLVRTMYPTVFRHRLPFIKQKCHQHDEEAYDKAQNTLRGCKKVPCRSLLCVFHEVAACKKQGSRGNADMDLAVAKTQERGNQTPTLSGEASKEEGENVIRSEILP
jgi:hypothetical protein